MLYSCFPHTGVSTDGPHQGAIIFKLRHYRMGTAAVADKSWQREFEDLVAAD